VQGWVWNPKAKRPDKKSHRCTRACSFLGVNVMTVICTLGQYENSSRLKFKFLSRIEDAEMKIKILSKKHQRDAREVTTVEAVV
jgi:hypothetical protein